MAYFTPGWAGRGPIRPVRPGILLADKRNPRRFSHVERRQPVPRICGGRVGAHAAGTASTAGAAVDEVVVVFKTHFDIGYTDLARNVVAKYRTSMIDNALAVCDGAKAMPPEHRFVWTLSGWPMEQVLWPGQTPERRRRIAEAIRDGRLVWHALPASLHTESLDLEDLVRGMVFSSRLSRQFGMPLPRDAKMTDVPAHTWVLPTVLKHAGVRVHAHRLQRGQQPGRGAAAVLVGRSRRLARADDVLRRLRHGPEAAGRLAVQDLAGADSRQATIMARPRRTKSRGCCNRRPASCPA